MIKKYTIKSTNVVGENAQFMVSYEGLPANNSPVDLSNNKNVGVWYGNILK